MTNLILMNQIHSFDANDYTVSSKNETITLKPKRYVVFLIMSSSVLFRATHTIERSGSEKNRFWWVWSGSEKSHLCGHMTVGVGSDVSLPLHMHAAVFAAGQWLCR